jgi:hypothetical protein
MNTRSLSVIFSSLQSSTGRRNLAWTGGILCLLSVCLVIVDTLTDRRAREQVAELFEGFNESKLVKLSYEGAGSSLLGGTVTVSEITLEAFGSTLDAGGLALYDYRLNEQGLPVVLKAQLRDTRIDPETLFPPNTKRLPLLQMLADIGYTAPTEGEIFVDWTFHEEERLTDLRTISLNIEDVGRFELESELIGLSTGAVAVLMLGMDNTIPVQISSLELEYRDDSLLSRVLEYIAEKQGKDSVDELVDELRATWERDQGLQVLFADELEQFLKNPRSLRIRIHPEFPVSMTQIGAAGSPQELADLLNFHLESN